MSRRLAAPAVMAVLALGAAGCGDDTSSDPQDKPESSAATQAPATSGSQAVTGHRTTVAMTEFAFAPKAMSAKAGSLRVTAENKGSVEHEFVLIRTAKAPNALATKGDEASEAGSVGEIPEQQPGKAGSHTFKLEPGRYVYICNVPGHFKAGMRGTLTVE